jgi:hypothetical protein
VIDIRDFAQTIAFPSECTILPMKAINKYQWVALLITPPTAGKNSTGIPATVLLTSITFALTLPISMHLPLSQLSTLFFRDIVITHLGRTLEIMPTISKRFSCLFALIVIIIVPSVLGRKTVCAVAPLLLLR